MRKPLLTAVLFLAALTQMNAQDKMKKHSGESLDVKIIRVNEFTINYKYPNEDAEQTIGKLAVAEITYGSGRKEAISDKVVVFGKDDWEKVQILTDKSQVIGLKKGGEVRGKTSGLLSYNTAGSADKKATKRIKQDAAEMNAPFILLTGDKNDGFGVKQSIKDGVVYTYK
ncbi:MAG TPA: hypothetical protein VFS22_02375 [Flavisolibacter sp.]|nr:hypothetical protein [Flavisolibacter sp.]